MFCAEWRRSAYLPAVISSCAAGIASSRCRMPRCPSCRSSAICEPVAGYRVRLSLLAIGIGEAGCPGVGSIGQRPMVRWGMASEWQHCWWSIFFPRAAWAMTHLVVLLNGAVAVIRDDPEPGFGVLDLPRGARAQDGIGIERQLSICCNKPPATPAQLFGGSPRAQGGRVAAGPRLKAAIQQAQQRNC